MLRPKRATPTRSRSQAKRSTPASSISTTTTPRSPFEGYLAAFLDWSLAAGYTARTIETRKDVIGWFVAWVAERGIDTPQEVSRPILERYQRHLYHYRKANGEPLSYGTQVHRVVPLKSFFKWLARENHVLYNPAADLTMPRLPHRLPKHVLSPQEVEMILAQPNVTTPNGVRDRAILETLYSTGMRRMELVNLKLFDVDLERGSVMIREGKGRKDRLIPIGDRACAWVEKYRDDIRPELVAARDDGTLFLTDYGEAFIKRRLGDLVRRYVDAANIGKRGSCHLFRHACATHMLEGGADIRFIQAMLGHADLSTTQIYTEVSLTKLKAVHALTHPARLKDRSGTQDAPGAARSPSAEANLQPLAAEARSAFLAALATESDDENDADERDGRHDVGKAHTQS